MASWIDSFATHIRSRPWQSHILPRGYLDSGVDLARQRKEPDRKLTRLREYALTPMIRPPGDEIKSEANSVLNLAGQRMWCSLACRHCPLHRIRPPRH